MKDERKVAKPKNYDPYLTKGLPQAVEIEKNILGSVLLDSNVIYQLIDRMQPEDLFLESHRILYSKMLRLAQQNTLIDLNTLSDELRKSDDFNKVGGATYIASLIDGLPRTDNLQPYLKILKEKSGRRRLITACNEIIENCFEEDTPFEDVINKAQAEIYALAEERVQTGFEPISKAADKLVDKLEAQISAPQVITGTATGFTDLDMYTSGLQRQDLVVVAARPSMGKTALATGIAQYAGKQQQVVGIFSLEMSNEQLAGRMLASEARVDAHRLRTGYLGREEWARIGDALRRLREYQIYVDDTPALSVLEMESRARQLKAQKGLDLLIADYLQLIKAAKRGLGGDTGRQQEVSQISRDLKHMAKRLDVPVIALSQLSRAPEYRSDKRPILSDLRDSGAIEQDADMVAFIYRAEMYEATDENLGVAELILAKQRNGPTGLIKLAFIKEFTRFENMWRD